MPEVPKYRRAGVAPTGNQKARAEYVAPTSTSRPNTHDTEAGMSPAVRSAVLSREQGIRNNHDESTHVFNDRGEEVQAVQGKGAKVTIVARDWPEFRRQAENGIITHNHPRSIGKTGLASIGNSFSHQDIYLALDTNAREMRAVTPRYTFSMKRPAGGWGITRQQAKNLLTQATKRANDKFREYGAQDNWSRTREERMQAAYHDEVNREFVKLVKSKYGVNIRYTHKRG